LGWRALVDERPAELYPAAGLYFAVALPPGAHTVALDYRTPDFRTGLAIAFGWSLVAASLSRRRRSGDHEGANSTRSRSLASST
jgi:uncharacterized membrane protein YfhO